MRDPKNLTISLLCVSAVILATALGVLHLTARPATADTPVRAGDYILLTGSVSTSVDLVYVIDVAEQKLNAYFFSAGKNEFKLVDQGKLQVIFREALR